MFTDNRVQETRVQEMLCMTRHTLIQYIRIKISRFIKIWIFKFYIFEYLKIWIYFSSSDLF